jgi:hypothetical protein
MTTFGAGAAANYLSSFGSGVPNPASLKMPEHLVSNAFTIGLGAIPQANLQAATNILSPIAQIGAQAKANQDYLTLQDQFLRRRDRLRLAGEIFGSMDFGGSGAAATAVAAGRMDPRRAMQNELDFQSFLRSKMAEASSGSRQSAAKFLEQMGG